VRIRQDFAAGSALRGVPRVLMEALTYGILPAGAESAVMVLVSWTVPGVTQEMERLSSILVSNQGAQKE
jgi:formaldehyde-activating enzyme involved in methanogenesis